MELETIYKGDSPFLVVRNSDKFSGPGVVLRLDSMDRRDMGIN